MARDFPTTGHLVDMMHYFTRKVLLGQAQSLYAPWEKFALFVQSNPQVA